MNRDTMSKILGAIILCVALIAYVILSIWDDGSTIQGLIVFVTPVVTYMLMRDTMNTISTKTAEIQKQTNGLLHQKVDEVADSAIARYAAQSNPTDTIKE